MGTQYGFEFLMNMEGQNEKDGITRITPAAAEYIQNMHYVENGTFSAFNQGCEAFSVQLESGADIDSLGYFTTDEGVDHLLCAVNGEVHDINLTTGADTATITSANTAGQPVDFQAFLGKVYMVDGTMTPQVWTGTGSASSVSALPLTIGMDIYDDPSIVEKFNNRLVYGCFLDNDTGPYPSHLVITDLLAPDTITTVTTNDTDGAVIQVSPGDGQRLTAAKALYFPQQGTEVLICFKEHSSYVLSGDTPDTFDIQLLSADYGCINNRCAVQVGNDILFMDTRNIHSITTATMSGNLQKGVIGSEMVINTLQELNLDQKAKSWAEHLPDRHEVWFGIPTGSSVDVDTILVCSYRTPGQYVWSVRRGHSARCALYADGLFYTGATDGYIDKWFTSSQYRGIGFQWVYRYPFHSFGKQTRVKRINRAHALFQLRGSSTVTIKGEWALGGNDTRQSQSKTKPLSTGSVYGVAVYGVDHFAITGGLIKHQYFNVLGNGLMWQCEVSGTTTDVAPDFLGIYGHYEMGDTNRVTI